MLILDEPTNHLDLESREALESALQAFPGALLLISHDRALLDAVGTRTIAVEDQTLHSYVGGWPEYVRVREERAEAERDAKARAKARPAKPQGQARARAGAEPSRRTSSARRARLEAEIEQAEAELAALEEELADPQAWNDPRAAREVDAAARRGEGADRGAVRGARGRGVLSAWRVRSRRAGRPVPPEANGQGGAAGRRPVTVRGRPGRPSSAARPAGA